MAPKDKSDPPDARPGWFGFGEFLMLVVFCVMLYWLGQSMVQHHFFSGGALNYRLSATR